MLSSAILSIFKRLPSQEAHAHCDGPCGVYDPASARIAAEAVLSMTKKLLALQPPEGNDASAWTIYNNTFSRIVACRKKFFTSKT